MKKQFIGYEAFTYIVYNTNEKLYNSKYGLRMEFDSNKNSIIIYDKNNNIVPIKINKEVLNEVWDKKEDKFKYCFRLYKNDNLIKVITQSCTENDLQKTLYALKNKFKSDYIKSERIDI